MFIFVLLFTYVSFLLMSTNLKVFITRLVNQAWKNLAHNLTYTPNWTHKKPVCKTEGHSQSQNNCKHCFPLFVTYWELAAFILNIISIKSFFQWGYCSFRQLTECCVNILNKMSLKEWSSYFRHIPLRKFRGICWEQKNIFATNVLINCRKFIQQIFMRTPLDRYIW